MPVAPIRLGLLAAVVVAWSHQGVAQTSSEQAAKARQLLTSRGLSPSGNFWITRREDRLKRVVESLESLERRHQHAITRAEEAISANEVIRARLAQSEAAEKARKSAPPPSTPEPTVPDSTGTSAAAVSKLNSQMTDVTGVGEQTPLQQAMIELVNARTAVQLAVLAIYRDSPSINAEYQALKTDAEIQAALKQINSNARLGPVRNYPRDVARAEVIAGNAFKLELPGYLESGRFRVVGILNDTQPATFNVELKEGPVLLAASVGERLGLTAKDFTEPPQEVDVAGRRLAARPIRLASLRLGAGYGKDIKALVLPPEAEDLGSYLSAPSLPGYRLTLQPRRMIVELNRQSASSQ